LDRKVALKFIRTSQRDHQAARTRLYREAQALAKLSHPNVVTVHDVGTHGDQVWLSMEFVAGATLGAWRRAKRPGWRDVLEVMKQAARGVAAAHRAGLLHRDLKADNIMVGDDGRARVMDFGLARAGSEEREELAEEREISTIRQDALSLELTAAGAMMGTPAYMAPEQFVGQAADERSDQYSLCATLWEALYGQRAHTGANLIQLVDAVTSGAPPRAPAGARVPGWLRRVVERGLAVDRERRHASVDALLAALEADPTRRRWLLGLGLGLALSGAAGLGVRHLQRARAIAACEAEGASIDEVWNADAQRRLHAGLVATAAPYAEAVAANVTPYFTAQAADWRRARVDTCLDVHVRDRWDDDTHERALGCLDARRLELEALVDELSRADVTAVELAVNAASGLGQVAPCRDPLRLATMPTLPRDRQGVRAFWRAKSAAMAQRDAGHFERGLELIAAARADAERLESPSLQADARRIEGDLLDHLGKYDDAEAAYEDAFFTGADAGAFELAADAGIGLVTVVGYRQARHDDGLRWSRQAEVMLSILGEDARSLRRARLLDGRGVILAAKGELEAAAGLFETTLSIRRDAFGPTHPRVAITLDNLANVRYAGGKYEEARALYEEALAIQEASLGVDHPKVATTLNNLAGVQEATGNTAEARALLERALTVRERLFGPDHPAVAMALGNLANVLRSSGAYADAEAMQRRALAIKERVYGPKHPSVAITLNNLAAVHASAGEREEARALYERAIALGREAFGPEHPTLGDLLTDYGDSLVARGEWDAAKLRFAQARAIFTA
ncbi:MAG: serine/threonine protein kinase, partial [Myxococcales bacterium]|nr:serine/threonine protein kinase [Myxococcales bacterium]